MRKLNAVSDHWEIYVEVGNDWGVDSYFETRIYKTEEEMEYALQNINYYDTPQSVKKVTEYRIDYEYQDD